MYRAAGLACIVAICGLGDRCAGTSEPEVGKKLELVSAPSGATVKVDGTNRGETPLTLTNLQVTEGQSQTITFEMDGYTTVSKDLVWTSAEQSLSASLEKTAIERVFTVKSDPSGAKVYANGEKKGTTPVTWSMELENDEEVNILVQKSGYSDIEEKISFEDAEEKTKTLEYDFVKAGKLKYKDLDRVLLKQEKRWRKACKTYNTDVCKFGYKVNKEGKVYKVNYVNCKDPAINKCTKKQILKMKFPAAEKGRSDKFTWFG